MKRDYISEEIRREVRRRDGFGCVVCRTMPCDYHHVVPYAKGGPNTVENLVLLCNNHHRDVSSGRLSQTQVRSFQKRVSANPTPAKYQFIHDPIQILSMCGAHYPLRENQLVKLISFGGGRAFSVTVYGGVPRFSYAIPDISGRHTFRVEDNVVYVTGRKTRSDFTIVGKLLKFGIVGRPEIKIKLDNGAISVEDLRIYCDGIAVRVSGDSVFVNDGTGVVCFGGNMFLVDHARFSVFATERDPDPAMTRLTLNSGKLTRLEALRWLRNSSARLARFP